MNSKFARQKLAKFRTGKKASLKTKLKQAISHIANVHGKALDRLTAFFK